MKSIWFTDLHIHNYKRFDVNGSRLKNCLSVLDDVFEAAEEMDALEIFHAGDLFDQQKHLPTVVINETVKKFTELFLKYPDILFISISGNHDFATKNLYNQQGVSAQEFLATIFQNFVLLDNDFIDTGSKKVHGVPYYEYAQDFYKAIEGVEADILMIHNTPEGITNKNIHTDFDPKVLDRFPRVMCGHIHDRQVIRKGFTILGTPLHRDLGDVGQQKGIYVYDSEEDKLQFCPLEYPEFGYDNESEFYVEEVFIEETDEVDTTKFSTQNSPLELMTNFIEQIKEDNELIKTGQRCL